MKPEPIFGLGLNAYSPLVSRQQRLNCFFDVRLDKDKEALICRGTPGSVLSVTLPNAPIRGWWVVNNLLYVVAGAGFYSVSTLGVVTTINTSVILTASGIVGMMDNGFHVMITDGVGGYAYTLVAGSYAQVALNAAGSFAKLTDANFPNGASTCHFLNGFAIAEQQPNSRRFSVSAAYDLTNWSYNSLPIYGTKDDYSDNIQAVEAVKGTLVPMGLGSIEFWQTVGTTPFPFSRIPGATQAVGLAAVNSRAHLNESLVFLGTSQDGGVQVFKLDGYQATPISTSDIDYIIKTFTTWQDAVGLTYLIDGHHMYQLTFPTAGRSFLYDDKTTFWSEVQTGLSLQARHFANIGIAFNSKNYVSDSSTGRIYQLSDQVYTDNGTPIKRQVASRHIHEGGNLFSIAQVFADFETGVGLQDGQGSDPKVMLQISKDNGRTFGPEKWADLGAVGKYLTRAFWRRLGRGRDFVFQLTVTDSVKFTIVHASATKKIAKEASQ